MSAEVDRDALFVLVRPQGSEAWLGTFAKGYASAAALTGVFESPAPGVFVAVSGGYGYIVNVREPENTYLIGHEPIVWTGTCEAPPLLLLADHQQIFGVQSAGCLWRSPALSSEGLTGLHVAGSTLFGVGWDMTSDREFEFSINLFNFEISSS